MKLWGGRFAGRRDARFEKFSESFSLDRRFIPYDLRVNLAYVQELGRVGVLQARGKRGGWARAWKRYGVVSRAILTGARESPARTSTPGSRRNWNAGSAPWPASCAPAAAATTW